MIVEAQSHYDRTEYAQAREIYGAALERAPTNSDAAEGLINALRHLRLFEEAERKAASYRERRPGDPWVELAAALAHAQCGRRDIAVELTESVLAANKEPTVVARAARVLREADHAGRADELLLATIKDTPDLPELRRELAAVRIKQKK